jgi:hypothetical protein
MCGGAALCGVSVCNILYAWGLEDVPVMSSVSTTASKDIGIVDCLLGSHFADTSREEGNRSTDGDGTNGDVARSKSRHG